MRVIWISGLVIWLAAVAVVVAGSGTDPREFAAYYAPEYWQPDPATMSASATRGKRLLNSTYRYLGAESPYRAANGRPYVGNRLSCANCHLDNGTRPNAMPLVVAAAKYKAPGSYSPREGVFRDLETRINGCFERSLAGEAIPRDSQWMKDMRAYLEWMAGGLQSGYTWKQVRGQGTPEVPLLYRPADPAAGAEIYEDRCRTCHQEEGQGVWDEDAKRYRYPAVWGRHSFGLMAGMGRLDTAVGFIKANMPYDRVNALDPSTFMSDDDAWDVTAYLLSKNRPYDSRFDADWSGVGPDGMPDWMRRSAAAAYPHLMPRDNNGRPSGDINLPPMFSLEQHRYGPFQPIQEKLKEAQVAWRANRP